MSTNKTLEGKISSSSVLFQSPKILMVSPEYPPINGGIGRYTYNLVSELRTQGLEVYVACDKKGDGDLLGISPENQYNSEFLLDMVDKIHPDIVHIQYEPGLFGLKLHPISPSKLQTSLDLFYEKCEVPIVTTFHSGYTLRQWMALPEMKLKRGGDSSEKKISEQTRHRKHPLSKIYNFLYNIGIYWKYTINYRAFQNQNRAKLRRSNTAIVFSNYMARKIALKGTNNSYQNKNISLIYHGTEPAISAAGISKKEARASFPSLAHIDNNRRLGLALGFLTAAKGWDILAKMIIPEKWTIVINGSKNLFSNAFFVPLGNPENTKCMRHIIDLQKDYLSDQDLSMLFIASDAVLLPYKITAGSGVMFDALGHGIPFVASDLPFFNEFAAKGLGLTVKRDPVEFTNALSTLDENYEKYKPAVDKFRKNLAWDLVARNHTGIYRRIIDSRKVLLQSEATATATTAATTIKPTNSSRL